MNLSIQESIELVTGLKRQLSDVEDVEVVVCPPFTHISAVNDVIKGSNIALGAQNLYCENNGAYTGEISASMLKDVGCEFVIIGHSERREYFTETDQFINKKIKKALEFGLKPIVCVGETLEQREANKTEKVVTDQIKGSLAGLTEDQMIQCVIAYEPVWAIGTGRTASNEQAQEVHYLIRNLLKDLFSPALAEKIRIQYGGSVKPDNIAGLMDQKDIDGALVGGASLKVDSFAKIVKFKG